MHITCNFYQDTGYSHHPESSLASFPISPTHESLLSFLSPKISAPVAELHINGIIKCVLFCMSFTQHVFEIHPCCLYIMSSFLLLFCSMPLLWICHYFLSILLSMDIWVSSNLWLSWIRLPRKFFLWIFVFMSLRYISGSGIARS